MPRTYEIIITKSGKPFHHYKSNTYGAPILSNHVEEECQRSIRYLFGISYNQNRRYPEVSYEDRGKEIVGTYAFVGEYEIFIDEL